MLGKSVLPRVLIRVTLLLPAHLPVLIGQRVSHSGGCRYVLFDGRMQVCKCASGECLGARAGHKHHFY